ncbi:MAG TPA: hypothetical protein VJJ46_04480, partial [Anaerolineales bacterium]|nr:hypothetical protein [Anaerolineales bacterium]
MNTRSKLAFMILGLVLTAAAPLPESNEPLGRAIAWLGDQQQPDGGYSNGFTSGSDVGTTADVVLAVALAGQASSFWGAQAPHPGDYLEAQVAAGSVSGPGLSAKVALAAITLG